MTSKLLASAAFLVLSFSVLTAAAQAPPPQPIAQGFGEGAYRPQPGITNPIALKQVEPKYTSEAMRAKIQGEVELNVVIRADGTIGDVRVAKSLDRTFGLDEEAIKAAKQWLFRPGMLDGKSVPVLVTLILEFRHGGPVPQDPAAPKPPTRTWIPDEEFLNGVARLGQPNVTMPVLERAVEPKYTSEAMRAKLMGTVTVDMVVAPDGSVLRTRIARSLDPALGLDRTALDAASQWRFKPGLVNGQPANVLVTVTMEFRLH